MAGKSIPDIPLLKGDSYREVYLRQDTERAPGVGPSLSHFEIHHRCIWNDVVPAHRLDFYMVFLVMAGEATHRFGVHEYKLGKNMLCFVGPDMISSWALTSGDQRGYICAFSDDFFHAGLADRQLISALPFFRLESPPVVQLTDEQTEGYVALFRLMEQEYAKTNKGTGVKSVHSHDVLRGYLHALIGKARTDYDGAGLASLEEGTGLRLLRGFTKQLNHDFEPIRSGKALNIRKVSVYAEMLGVSQNHLNDTIQSLTGLSAGQHIRNRLIRQATMCLMHSDKTVSEIAYLLGYEDPSYFARFYKRQTGKAPSEFRQK